ncbi:TIGR02530 family flagellar biosynthesis protein [Clostridium sp. Cult2]|uniref:TIGR02530 family flagellar biosynthesis protein n=1 Tax=Clostridium sp. Cult2 TaxID=2079003 RepID=UPI001F27FD5A|nr:TIGR02530 family flagellar biosynthesis protein [Clostridium sp. Cult2]MCF6466309.1 flagellar protein [Clostridium sp. Cult2]
MNNIQIKRLENQLINSSKISAKNQNLSNKNFDTVLQQIQNRDDEIRFSKHAINRMDTRDMTLSSEELERLKSGFNKAEAKGVKDALILIGDKAFIASIKNKTIITSVNKEQLKDNVFTNIDGAVIV